MKDGAAKITLEIAKYYDAKIYTIDYNQEKTFPEFSEIDITVLKKPAISGILSPFGKKISDGLGYGLAHWSYKINEEYDIINAQGTPSEFIRRLNPGVIWYCLHKGTKILTTSKRGGPKYSTVENLKTGDYVYSFNQKFKISKSKILKIFKRKSKNLNIVRLKNGREIISTRDHKFFIFDKFGKLAIKKTAQLNKDDRIPIPLKLTGAVGHTKELNVKKILNEKFSKHKYWKDKLFVSFDGKKISIGNRKVISIPSKIKITKEFMRFLGYYVSEGYIHFRHAQKREDMQMGLSFGIHENKLVEDAKKCIKKSFGITPKIKKVPKNSETIITLPNIVALFILSLDCGSKARDKQVPDLVFKSQKKMQKEFLKAYMNGDGYFEKGAKRWRGVTVSGNLANSLLYLLTLLGKQASIIRRISRKFNDYNTRLKHQIYTITYPTKAYKRYEKKGDLLLVPVKEVLKLNPKENIVYDIEVSGNHSFLAGDCIFTHNCHSPNREVFDLYEYRQKKRNFIGKTFTFAASEIFKKMEYSVVPKIEKIVTNSKNVKNRVKKYLKRDDADVVYSFVDKKDYSWGSYKKYFFYPSRFAPEKRFELIIEAFKKFSRVNTNFKLILAGFLNERNKEYFEYLKKLAKGYEIKFVTSAPQSKIRELYSECYCVLFAGLNEDLGLIPFEAGMSKKSIISTKEGGPKETIIDNKTGFLVEPSSKGFLDKMAYLSERAELAEEMGKAGYRNISKNFSKKKFFERFDKAVKEALK